MPKITTIKNNLGNFIANAKSKVGEFASTTTKTLKSPISLKIAKYGRFALGAVAAGLAIDYVFNKISAHKADKKA